MVKKIILTFIVLVGFSSAYAEVTCPANEDVFFVSAIGNLIKFVGPSGSVDDPQVPYAAPSRFNLHTTENKITASNATSYDPVKQISYGMGATCTYNMHWKKGSWLGNAVVSIYYCGSQACYK
jgi:hypothetical protein